MSLVFPQHPKTGWLRPRLGGFHGALHLLLGRHADLRGKLHNDFRGHVGDLLTHLAVGLRQGQTDKTSWNHFMSHEHVMTIHDGSYVHYLSKENETLKCLKRGVH